jgi:hypothetical protein
MLQQNQHQTNLKIPQKQFKISLKIFNLNVR